MLQEVTSQAGERTHSSGTWEVCWNPFRAEMGALGIWNGTHSVAHAMPCSEIEANARLIAAAPELLAALKALASVGHRAGLNIAGMIGVEEMKSARAAIAKAEKSEQFSFAASLNQEAPAGKYFK